MIAGAGCYLWFGREWTLHQRWSIRTRCQGKSCGMNNNRIHADAHVDFLAELLQSFRRMLVGFQTERLSELETFLLIETQDDIKILLEHNNQFQGAQNIFMRPFLRVRQIDE